MNIKDYFLNIKEEVDDTLDRYIPKEDAYPTEIYQAMRYSLFAGGKRLRPVLLIAATEAVGGRREFALPFAAAIEMIHTYTLIHDDLPALDNDDLRRGMPTSHKKFGEAIAILAGDALLTIAFQIISDPKMIGNLSSETVCKVIYEISKAVGASGTIGGQVVDILSEKKQIDIATLEYIHIHKTGVMITSSVRAGGIIGNCSGEELTGLTSYARNIGLAFQIIDDILDIESTPQELGKDIGSDMDNLKATYPAIVGMKESKETAQALIKKANSALEILEGRGDVLKEIAEYIIKRKN